MTRIHERSSGGAIWQKTVGGAGSDWGSALCVTKSGEVVVTGHTNPGGFMGSMDVFLLKLR